MFPVVELLKILFVITISSAIQQWDLIGVEVVIINDMAQIQVFTKTMPAHCQLGHKEKHQWTVYETTKILLRQNVFQNIFNWISIGHFASMY